MSQNVAGPVTVVIPTRNRRELLLRTLATVLSQVGVQIDVVVVDEGSTDGTVEALARLRNNSISVIRHEQPRGVAAARNAGIAAASADWVAFVDDDDLWAPAKLRAQLDAAQTQQDAQWVCSGAVRLDAQLRLGGPERPPRSSDVLASLFSSNVIPGGASGVLARTHLVREVGAFDEGLSNLADYDLWIRLGLASPVGIVDRPLVGYRVHRSGMAHDVCRSELELARIEAKYRQLRQEHGIEISPDAFLWYFGSMYLRLGQRGPAVRTHLRLALHGDEGRWQALAAAVLGGAAPGLQPLRDRLQVLRLTPAWRQEAESWIAPLRSAPGPSPTPSPSAARPTSRRRLGA
ncbi:MAG: glycosyltransferase family 2 protein [Mycobacteriales bacterium]